MQIKPNSIKLKCPACSAELVLKEKSYLCEKGHLYDVSKLWIR